MMQLTPYSASNKVHRVRVIGPRELDAARQAGETVIWTVSNASNDWQRELSPFHLGPVPLYDGTFARCMEGAWQFAKVYEDQVDVNGNPTSAYWDWARRGWASPAIRYPRGKGARPQYCLWAGHKLGYVDARKQVYWPLYQAAVKQTSGFRRLQALHAEGPIALFDFDGYDHDERGLSLAEVSEFIGRPMGHAFVLKAMLLFGVNARPQDLPRAAAAAQLELF